MEAQPDISAVDHALAALAPVRKHSLRHWPRRGYGEAPVRGQEDLALSLGKRLTSSSWKPSSKVNSKIVPTEKHAMAQAYLKSVLLDVKAQKTNSKPGL